MEGNGDKLRLWNDRAALGRHIWQGLVGLCFLAGTATAMYLLLDFRVKAADDRSVKNEAAIEQLKDNVTKLTTGQMLLNQAVTNDRANNADFRARTDKALESIIEKLDEAERRERRESR